MCEADMEVVGTAPDPYGAHTKILALKPDVVTLDIEMPRMDGLTFLKRLMKHNPIPTIIVSSLGHASCAATLDALRFGAVDVLAKPAGPYSVEELRDSLAVKIRSAAAAKPRALAEAESHSLSTAIPACDPLRQADTEMVVAIGASTGGTVAIQDILLRLPADMPGMLITQHIPAGFSQAFAKRLDSICPMTVKEAATGDVIQRGQALIAPGDQHLLLRRMDGNLVVELQQGPQVCYQRPSVDVMFTSIAQAVGSLAVGVLLTGMGADGARGLLTLKRAGAQTIAQDETSCVIYGMPREAAILGAVETVAALSEIPRILTHAVSRQPGIMAHSR
jgi:two-component system, chemotaxis family, protein-glutamate methylesterase/glutaminase